MFLILFLKRSRLNCIEDHSVSYRIKQWYLSPLPLIFSLVSLFLSSNFYDISKGSWPFGHRQTYTANIYPYVCFSLLLWPSSSHIQYPHTAFPWSAVVSRLKAPSLRSYIFRLTWHAWLLVYLIYITCWLQVGRADASSLADVTGRKLGDKIMAITIKQR